MVFVLLVKQAFTFLSVNIGLDVFPKYYHISQKKTIAELSKSHATFKKCSFLLFNITKHFW